MSLSVYLDDSAYSKRLVGLLERAGHTVTTPASAGTMGQDDRVHFQYAAEKGTVLLTKNPSDFEKLHQENRSHSGIFAVYQDNDVRKDMTYNEIVRAIDNLLGAGVSIVGEFHILNMWRY